MKLPQSITTVTPFSKYLALVLFIVLPLLGFYLGTKYQESITPKYEQVLVNNKITPDNTANWKTYTNKEYGYSLKYPSNLIPEEKSFKESDLPLLQTNFVSSQNGISPDIIIEVTKGGDIEPRIDYVKRRVVGHIADKIKNETKITIAGFEGKQLSYEVTTTNPKTNTTTYFLMDKVIFSNGSYTYTITTEDSLINQILSTFKFLEQNQQPEQEKITLPVTILETSYGISGITPTYPQTITINAPSEYASQLVAYGVAEKTIVAPKNWTGKGNVGADGSNYTRLYPINGSEVSGQHIIIGEVPACVGCALGEAALYFPHAKNLYEKDFPAPLNVPNDLKIQNISSNLVKYSLPNTTEGLAVSGVAYFKVTETQPYFIKMEVAFPEKQHDLAVNLLDIFINQQGLNK